MQTGRTDPQEVRNDQSTVFQKIRSFLWRIGNQEQARTVADHIKLKAILGERAFVFAAPKLWNALPRFIRETKFY